MERKVGLYGEIISSLLEHGDNLVGVLMNEKTQPKTKPLRKSRSSNSHVTKLQRLSRRISYLPDHDKKSSDETPPTPSTTPSTTRSNPASASPSPFPPKKRSLTRRNILSSSDADATPTKTKDPKWEDADLFEKPKMLELSGSMELDRPNTELIDLDFLELNGEKGGLKLRLKGNSPGIERDSTPNSASRRLRKTIVIETSVIKPIKLPDCNKSKESIEPVVLQKEVPPLLVEGETLSFDQSTLEFAYIPDIYKLNFAGNQHVNWICVDEKKPEEYSIISIKETVDDKHFKGLINSKLGWSEFQIPEEKIKYNRELKKIPSSLEKYLKENNPTSSYFRLRGDIIEEIKNIERDHRQVVKFMPVSVIYCKAGQTDPLMMFENRPDNTEHYDRFEKFLALLGVPKDYSSQSKDTSYWRGNNVTWHIAPKMDAEGHRRFIGNTQCTLIFHETQEIPFNPSDLANLGPIPQFFIVVVPYGDKWR
eukprot:TRINITY_DN8603_c0_g1_i1.p1 TRINITY_DN8603_c0_g1~~TRINITY_DN8603_c0_g1_i1.p1  ORF type:complete len:543 (+),score=140.79 TRINITY_DN8603_c0_g1_i1:192-1631(+)